MAENPAKNLPEWGFGTGLIYINSGYAINQRSVDMGARKILGK